MKAVMDCRAQQPEVLVHGAQGQCRKEGLGVREGLQTNRARGAGMMKSSELDSNPMEWWGLANSRECVPSLTVSSSLHVGIRSPWMQLYLISEQESRDHRQRKLTELTLRSVSVKHSMTQTHWRSMLASFVIFQEVSSQHSRRQPKQGAK